MKKIALIAAALFAAGMVSSGALAADEMKGKTEQDQASQPSQQQREQQAGQQQSEQQRQLAGAQQQIQAIDDIQGFKVQNQQGEQLGEISELLIDVEQGKVGYAVVSSGGVLGMGEEKYIVPFNALKLDQQQNVLTLDMDKEKLKQAPQGDVQAALDQQTGREIHQFYGVSPYWEEGAQQQQESQQDQMQRDQLQQDQMQQRDQIQQRDPMPQERSPQQQQ